LARVEEKLRTATPTSRDCNGDKSGVVPLSDFVHGAYRASLDSICVTDLDGVIVDVNPAFEVVTGYRREEAVGKKVGHLVGTDHNRGLYPAMWETLLATGLWEGEFINRRRDGSDWVSEHRISLVVGSNGCPLGYVSVARDVTEQRRTEEALKSHSRALKAGQARLEALLEESMMALARACEVWEWDTAEHLNRVRTVSQHLAERLGFPRAQARFLGLAAVVHDIGKIGVAREIITKPGSLTTEEWEAMQQHPLLGLDILPNASEVEWARQIVHHHHENFDGSGYPDGLAGEDIPLPARIVRVADSLDAMLSDRPYRKSRPLEEALGEIHDLAGKQFDPRVVEALDTVVGEGIIGKLYSVSASAIVAPAT
jgi:PAS domain S-box-containing protein